MKSLLLLFLLFSASTLRGQAVKAYYGTGLMPLVPILPTTYLSVATHDEQAARGWEHPLTYQSSLLFVNYFSSKSVYMAPLGKGNLGVGAGVGGILGWTEMVRQSTILRCGSDRSALGRQYRSIFQKHPIS